MGELELVIDIDKHEVIRGAMTHDLPKKEFEILCLLCEDLGKVFSRQQIFDKVWGLNSISQLRTVDVHIVSIRKKIGADLIKNIKGVGYKANLKKVKIQNVSTIIDGVKESLHY